MGEGDRWVVPAQVGTLFYASNYVRSEKEIIHRPVAIFESL